MIRQLPIVRFAAGGREEVEDVVVKESSLAIILNGQEIATLLCSPASQEYLALGFLLSQGILNSKEDVSEVVVDDETQEARVRGKDYGQFSSRTIIASSGSRESTYGDYLPGRETVAKSKTCVTPDEIFALMDQFRNHCGIYRGTGGTHGAALCDRDNILVSSEDIGRHNAVDKVFGECFARDIATSDRIMLTSGRVSSEILRKMARRNVPIVASISAPTDLGVKLAGDCGITLLGFIREGRINAYTNPWRLLT